MIDEENESKESRQIKEVFVSRHVLAANTSSSSSTSRTAKKVNRFQCGLCGEIILELTKYKPQTKDEYIDILFNHLILKHEKEIHYGKGKFNR